MLKSSVGSLHSAHGKTTSCARHSRVAVYAHCELRQVSLTLDSRSEDRRPTRLRRAAKTRARSSGDGPVREWNSMAWWPRWDSIPQDRDDGVNNGQDSLTSAEDRRRPPAPGELSRLLMITPSREYWVLLISNQWRIGCEHGGDFLRLMRWGCNERGVTTNHYGARN